MKTKWQKFNDTVNENSGVIMFLLLLILIIKLIIKN